MTDQAAPTTDRVAPAKGCAQAPRLKSPLGITRKRVPAIGILIGAAGVLGACTAQTDAPGDAATPRPVALATPAVTMEADPPPPFTYWAPEGATIRNHPREPATWIAEIADGTRKFYFGDQCRAAERQGWIGQPVDALPEPPAGSVWRVGCSTCEQTSDLRRDRLNVAFDQNTRRIVEIGCG